MKNAVAVVTIDVLEEYIVSIISVTRIDQLGATIAVIIN
jgi:hypothetical protein